MRDSIAEPSALIDALRVETAGYRALIRVLEAERDALRAADPDALLAVTATKLDHVSALHRLAAVRGEKLAQAGWPDVTTALVSFARSPDGAIVRRDWSELLSLAATARRLNDVNGRLIANQQRHFDGALQSLLQAAGVPPVYGADGRPQRTGSPRPRAAA
jgi:flagella synthesis protein FlgN